MAVPYELPRNWIAYDRDSVFELLARAKAAILALTEIPYQRSWAEDLQKVQLKREVAGTSRIEGAEFTERELDRALSQTPEQLETRSQRQAAAAVAAYRWIAGLPEDRPIDSDLIREVHRRIVTGCDDDHCPPGEFRSRDQNVTFGSPRHRGCEGGDDCSNALRSLSHATTTSFRTHDPLIQALAVHYHVAAMHPFLDGNGRTARALEALMLQRVGLRDTLFIAMSNYYYEEKTSYLGALSDTRAAEHDLTPFLRFALAGIDKQCRRLFAEIRLHVQKALFRNTMTSLFERLRTPRRRVMSGRQIRILNLLLDHGAIALADLTKRTASIYEVQNPYKALIRDLNSLIQVGAVEARRNVEGADFLLDVRLEWPMTITETEFFRRIRMLPRTKVHGFLSS